MKVARVNGRTVAVMDSALGLGGSTPQPDVGDLGDVDLTGINVGDVLIWDGSAWVPGPGGGDPVDDTHAWMPLTTVVAGEPVLVWDGDDNLIPTLTPV